MELQKYPITLDEIDQWLADNFGILPGACSSTENLRHNTARMIAEVLWPWEEAVKASFQQGYEQAEKDTIERAIDWLKDYVKYFEIYDEKGVEEFRKAMEEKK